LTVLVGHNRRSCARCGFFGEVFINDRHPKPTRGQSTKGPRPDQSRCALQSASFVLRNRPHFLGSIPEEENSESHAGIQIDASIYLGTVKAVRGCVTKLLDRQTLCQCAVAAGEVNRTCSEGTSSVIASDEAMCCDSGVVESADEPRKPSKGEAGQGSEHNSPLLPICHATPVILLPGTPSVLEDVLQRGMAPCGCFAKSSNGEDEAM